MRAARNRKNKIVRLLLLDERVEVNLKCKNGYTAAWYAATHGNNEALMMMIAYRKPYRLNLSEEFHIHSYRGSPLRVTAAFTCFGKHFFNDPVSRHLRARRELRLPNPLDCWAAIMFLQSGLLAVAATTKSSASLEEEKARRCLLVAGEMPQELVHVLCCRAHGFSFDMMPVRECKNAMLEWRSRSRKKKIYS